MQNGDPPPGSQSGERGIICTLGSLSTYPFPLFFEEWGLDRKDVAEAWDNRGDIVIGSDVWIGYEAVLLAGVTIGDGRLSAPVQWRQRMFRPIPLSAVYPPKRFESVFRRRQSLPCSV